LLLRDHTDIMKKQILYTVLAATTLVACTAKKEPQEPQFTVRVANSLDFDRTGEVVIFSGYQSIKDSLKLDSVRQLILVDAEGNQLPYQVTANNASILFPATVKANDTTEYTFKVGTPEVFAAKVFGKQYPNRVDDIAWENEYSAYRLYGPALQASGERAFGYDVWTKSVDTLVVDARYHNELDSQPIVDSLKAAGKADEAAEYYHSVSYHVDHGNGLDCYKVGPTLGGGTTALYQDGKIVYPYCYKHYEIVENGPLRFTVKLDYGKVAVGGDSVIEHRILSALAGSRLNQCTVYYTGLSNPTQVVTGLVIHPENVDSMATNAAEKYIAYADLTDNVNNDNGVIYVGAVCPTMKEARAEYFSTKEAKTERGDAAGHVLAVSDYEPGTMYEYYFGSSWSKGGMPSLLAWEEYLAKYAQQVAHPLTVTVK
jgi:hypothetical protein